MSQIIERLNEPYTVSHVLASRKADRDLAPALWEQTPGMDRLSWLDVREPQQWRSGVACWIQVDDVRITAVGRNGDRQGVLAPDTAGAWCAFEVIDGDLYAFVEGSGTAFHRIRSRLGDELVGSLMPADRRGSPLRPVQFRFETVNALREGDTTGVEDLFLADCPDVGGARVVFAEHAGVNDLYRERATDAQMASQGWYSRRLGEEAPAEVRPLIYFGRDGAVWTNPWSRDATLTYILEVALPAMNGDVP